jgi:hypothetical protein
MFICTILTIVKHIPTQQIQQRENIRANGVYNNDNSITTTLSKPNSLEAYKAMEHKLTSTTILL